MHSDNSKQVRNICTEAIKEDRFQYHLRSINEFVNNPKNLIRYAASLLQVKTEVSQLQGPNGSTNNDGDASTG